jgi:SAM-dependent methyltransferase
MTRARYDQIGRSYAATRRADPRFAAVIERALGDARTVVNVGAGAGSYEPADREVTAVEPSAVMIAQRPPHAAPVIQASAERLPFEDGRFDAAMAIFSDHHWTDRDRGLLELRRVARRRVVMFNANPGELDLFWFTNEYLPEFLDLLPTEMIRPGAWEERLREVFGSRLELIPMPVPHDCMDGFYGAYWRRPGAYLDPAVRAGVSVFSQVAAEHVEWAVDALRADLASGAWERRHRDLLELEELNLGYYVVVAELAGDG